MKDSNQAKTTELEDGADKISNMPDHVLQSILSRIPSTEEVVRTSILSRRWRHLWTSVPSIDIDFTRRGLNNPYRSFNSNGFKEFVNWVLLNKPLDLDSFRLQCGDYYNMSTIGSWIHAAVKRKVKLLDLMFGPTYESGIFEEGIELPDCLVTCGSLEVLKLCLLHDRICLPKFTGFQALRVLELRRVNLDDIGNLVEYFLESCPMLEDLSLIDCRAPKALVISSSKLVNLRIRQQRFMWVGDSLKICCPKLEFLEFTGSVVVSSLFENLYSLKKAVIHPENIAEGSAFNLFAGISHVEYLSINIPCIKPCFDPRVNAPISLLPNLKTLEITIDGLHNMDALIRFLKCLPDLESLHLIISKYYYGLDELNLEEAETISILTRRLKKVKFLEFDEEKPKLVVARALLLEHGSLLEEMVFCWADKAKFHEKSTYTMNQVSKFHKASSTIKFTTVLNPS